MIKRILLAGTLPVAIQAGCVVYSCDKTISYAIGRYGEKIVKRLDDYKKTIAASTRSDQLYGKVLDEQNRELVKLIARSSLENIYIKEMTLPSNRQKHLSKRYNQ